MSALVLGSSGFLGSSLEFHLATHVDLKVRGVSRRGRPDYLVEDYSSESLKHVLDKEEPDVVINCAGIVGHENVSRQPQVSERVNVDMPKAIAKLTKEREISFVHFSSDSVYSGNPEEAPFSEYSPTTPFSRYGVQKLQSESRVLDANPDSTILRVNFFGWSREGKSGVLDHFVSHGVAGTQPIGYSSYFVSSLYVGELSQVVFAVIRKGAKGVFNVGSRDSLSKLRFGQAVFARIGLDPQRVIAGNPSSWTLSGVKIRDLSMCSDLIESTLGINLGTQLGGISTAFDELHSYLSFWKMTDKDSRQRFIESSVR